MSTHSLSKYFTIEEIFPPEFIEQWGEQAWRWINPLCIITLHELRREYGTITVNDWNNGGKYKYRGFRPPGCTVGAELSQHRFGNAIDCKFKNFDEKRVREDFLYGPPKECFKHITEVEQGINWFHFACSGWDREQHGVLRFKP